MTSLGERTTYIFVDECGDLGRKGSASFIIVALETRSPGTVSKIIKNARRKFVKNKMPEIKGHNSDDRIRLHVLSALSSCDCRLHVAIVPKGPLLEKLLTHKEKAFDHLCGMLLGCIYLSTDKVAIVIDKRHRKHHLREEFNRHIEEKIREKCPDIEVGIQHLESHSSNELMVVDFVAWAAHRHFDLEDSSYYKLIEEKVRNRGSEIWKK